MVHSLPCQDPIVLYQYKSLLNFHTQSLDSLHFLPGQKCDRLLLWSKSSHQHFSHHHRPCSRRCRVERPPVVWPVWLCVQSYLFYNRHGYRSREQEPELLLDNMRAVQLALSSHWHRFLWDSHFPQRCKRQYPGESPVHRFVKNGWDCGMVSRTKPLVRATPLTLCLATTASLKTDVADWCSTFN